MAFEKKTKTMTIADQIQQKVTVVSTPPANEHVDAVVQLQDEGNRQEPVIEETNFKPDFADVEQTVSQHQAQQGRDAGEFVGFSPTTTTNINRMTAREVDNFMRNSIVARPLRLPNRLDCRAKDPNFRLRWVEMKAEDGRRYHDCCTMGFRNAKAEEVVWNGASIKPNSDGTIIDNDLILMIISTEIILGAYKHNALRALGMVTQRGSAQLAKREGDKTMRQGIADEGYNPNSQNMKDAFGRPKLEIYDPGASNTILR